MSEVKKATVQLGKDGPAKTYAVPHSRPQLNEKVESGMAKYSLLLSGIHKSAKINECDNYYIKEKKAHYQGGWKDKLPNGYGTVIYADGSYFQGQFVNGHAQDPKGFLVLSNGSVYQGNIEQSVVRGAGKMRYTNENGEQYTYQGNWEDGKPHGYGEETYSDGSSYQGNFQNGVKHGQGTYFNKSRNETYKGEFRNGLMDGQGEIKSSNGSNYKGQFVRGKKIGQGVLTNQKGELRGEFNNDQLNGPGEFRWKDDRVYKGNFKKSQFHGQGKIYYKSGQVVSGVWQQGHNKILNTVAKQ